MMACDKCGSVAWKATKIEILESTLEFETGEDGFESRSGSDALRWRFACKACGAVAATDWGTALYAFVADEDRVFRDERAMADDLAHEYRQPQLVLDDRCPMCHGDPAPASVRG